MLVLKPEHTDGFHINLASLSTEERERLETILPLAITAAIDAAPHWDFELSAKKIDEIIGTEPEDEATSVIRRGIIASWALELPRRIASYNLPLDVFEAYPSWLDRLAVDINAPTVGYDRDHWAKDVRFALGLSVPGSRTHLIDLASPVGPKQAIMHVVKGRGLTVPFRWVEARGWGSWIEVHTESRNLADFSPEGWDKAWLSMAGIVERYPGLRGGIGSSWFYDPPLTKISPRLAYLRQTPAKHGAFFIHQGGGAIHSERASASSPTRRAMIESGEYVPHSWLLVWPRRALLRWARQERQRQAALADIIEQAEETGAITNPA